MRIAAAVTAIVVLCVAATLAAIASPAETAVASGFGVVVLKRSA